MGRKYSDPEVQKGLELVPYKVSAAPNGDVRVHMGGREYSPPQPESDAVRQLKAQLSQLEMQMALVAGRGGGRVLALFPVLPAGDNRADRAGRRRMAKVKSQPGRQGRLADAAGHRRHTRKKHLGRRAVRFPADAAGVGGR